VRGELLLVIVEEVEDDVEDIGVFVFEHFCLVEASSCHLKPIQKVEHKKHQ